MAARTAILRSRRSRELILLDPTLIEPVYFFVDLYVAIKLSTKFRKPRVSLT